MYLGSKLRKIANEIDEIKTRIRLTKRTYSVVLILKSKCISTKTKVHIYNLCYGGEALFQEAIKVLNAFREDSTQNAENSSRGSQGYKIYSEPEVSSMIPVQKFH